MLMHMVRLICSYACMIKEPMYMRSPLLAFCYIIVCSYNFTGNHIWEILIAMQSKACSYVATYVHIHM